MVANYRLGICSVAFPLGGPRGTAKRSTGGLASYFRLRFLVLEQLNVLFELHACNFLAYSLYQAFCLDSCFCILRVAKGPSTKLLSCRYRKIETKRFLLRQWTRLPKATFSFGGRSAKRQKYSRGQVRKPRWPKVSEPVNVETTKTVCTGESAKLSPATSVEYRGSQDASINFTLSGGVTRKTMVVELWSRQSFCGYVELTVKASLVGAWQRTSACV